MTIGTEYIECAECGEEFLAEDDENICPDCAEDMNDEQDEGLYDYEDD